MKFSQLIFVVFTTLLSSGGACPKRKPSFVACACLNNDGKNDRQSSIDCCDMMQGVFNFSSTMCNSYLPDKGEIAKNASVVITEFDKCCKDKNASDTSYILYMRGINSTALNVTSN